MQITLDVKGQQCKLEQYNKLQLNTLEKYEKFKHIQSWRGLKIVNVLCILQYKIIDLQ